MTILCFFIICLLLTFSKEISKITTNVVINFYFNVLPLLAPTIIFNNIFIYSGGVPLLLQKSKLSSQAKHSINKYSLILLGVLSGTPALASMINSQINKSISKKEAQNILNCFSAPSLPFLIALINSSCFDIYIKVLVIFLPLFIELILFVISDKKSIEFRDNNCVSNCENIISTSILSSAHTIILMSGSIIIFAILSAPLKLLFHGNYLYLIQGLIEFSYPLHLLFKSSSIVNLIFIMIIIAFSSLSLIVQVKLITPLVSLRQLIKKRLIITAIVALISVILFSF